jgi:ribosome-associated toxin RatA of RatAB toxin-antitoxin module
MHNECSLVIHAPMEKIYAMTSDLTRWPELLPHYRWVRWLSGGPDTGIIEMAALRGLIPISWTSEYRRDPQEPMLNFRHLKAFTKGMEVRWLFKQESSGVRVVIEHDLNFRWPLLAPLAEPIIGNFMIDWVAPRTLATFKKLLEESR